MCIGPELYEMKEGDFAIVFPELIHHYQVFSEEKCRAIYLYVAPSLITGFLTILQQAFVQIILAKSLPQFELIGKSTIGRDDIVYQTVSYIAANFCEPLSLTQMANDLGYSPYTLSRVFSGTFQKNFVCLLEIIEMKIVLLS